MHISVQVIGIYGGDSSPALLVATETQRFLFNAGEGLQRFCMEHRVRLSRVDGVFVTHVGNDTMGGLPGMLLTLADMGKRRMTLYGGAGAYDYMRATRHFMRRNDVDFRVVEAPALACAPKLPAHSDSRGYDARNALATLAVSDRLSVEAYLVDCTSSSEGREEHPNGVSDEHLLRARIDAELTAAGGWPPVAPQVGARDEGGSNSGSICSGNIDGTGAPGSRPNAFPPLQFHDCPTPADLLSWGPFNPLRFHVWPTSGGCTPAAATPTAVTSMGSVATSFVCSGPPVVGRFHPARAAALGLRPGPVYGRLQRGEAVEVEVSRAIAATHGLRPIGVEADDVSGRRSSDSDVVATNPSTSMNDVALASPPAAHLSSTVRVIVTPQMVKDNDTPGPAFAVISCPTLKHLAALRAHDALRRRLTLPSTCGSAAASAPGIIFHVAPADVVESPEYRAWLLDEDAWARGGVQHVLMCGSASRRRREPLLACAQGAQIVALHVLSPRAFTLPFPLADDTALQSLRSHGWASPMQAAVAQRLALKLKLNDEQIPSFSPSLGGIYDAAADGMSVRLTSDRVASNASVSSAASASTIAGSTIVYASPLQAFEISGSSSAPSESKLKAKGGKAVKPAVAAVAALSQVGRTVQESPPTMNTPFGLVSLPDVVLTAVVDSLLSDDAISKAYVETLRLYKRAARASNGRFVDAHSTQGTHPPPHGFPLASVPPPVPPGVRVVFTGTSSAVPSKYRNVSGAYLALPPPQPTATSVVDAQQAHARGVVGNAVLLDCGEGTVGQLMRRFGAAASAARRSGPGVDAGVAEDIVTGDSMGLADVHAALLRVSVVWISHMHADHHLGLLRLIATRNAAAAAMRSDLTLGSDGDREAAMQPPPPILIVGPTRLFHWILEAARVDPSIRRGWRFADAEHFAVRPSHTSAHPKPAPASDHASQPGAHAALRMDVEYDGSLSSAGAGAAHFIDGEADDGPRHALLDDGSPSLLHFTQASVVGSAVDPTADDIEDFAEAFPTPIDSAVSTLPLHLSSAVPPPQPLPSSTAGSGIGGCATGVDVEISHARDGGALPLPTAAGSSESAPPNHAQQQPPPTKRARIDISGVAGDDLSAQSGGAPPPTSAEAVHPSAGDTGDGGRSIVFGLSDPAPSAIPLDVDDIDGRVGDVNAAVESNPPLYRASRSFIVSTLASMGIARFLTTRVVHCHKAYALRLDVLRGDGGGRGGDAPGARLAEAAHHWSLVYSGDTRPCAAVVALGRGGDALSTTSGRGALAHYHDAASSVRATDTPPHCDDHNGVSLLIHEATFEDTAEGAQSALEKRHSTAAEALSVARACGARHVVLTHFSARYPKLPVVPAGGTLWEGWPLQQPPSQEQILPRVKETSSAGIKIAECDAEQEAQLASSTATVEQQHPSPPETYRPIGTVFVAYDLMTLRSEDLDSLPALLPALHALFRDDRLAREELLQEAEAAETEAEVAVK